MFNKNSIWMTSQRGLRLWSEVLTESVISLGMDVELEPIGMGICIIIVVIIIGFVSLSWRLILV